MTTAKKEKYIEAIGRRKTSTARIRITPSSKTSITVNDKAVADYFPTEELQKVVEEALNVEGLDQKFSITVKVRGGGIHSQAESLRLGIARALVEFNEELRGDLKTSGFLKRDPRAKERRKFGLKKARKAAQWSKR
jgi:small subunit ribosomal protein S9